MMGETGPMGLHSKGRKTDMKTAAKRERKTLRIVELALLLGAAAFLMTGVWALNTQRDLADKVVRLHVLANSDSQEDQALKRYVRDQVLAQTTPLLEGVTSAKADHNSGTVEVTETRNVPENDFKSAILKAGYEYEGMEA